MLSVNLFKLSTLKTIKNKHKHGKVSCLAPSFESGRYSQTVSVHPKQPRFTGSSVFQCLISVINGDSYMII